MQFFIFVVAFVAVIYGLKFLRKQRAAARRDAQLFEMLRPLTNKIELDPNTIQPVEIEQVAENNALRLALWQWLDAQNLLHLFPKKYDHREAGATANLCYQLLSSDELDAQPDLVEVWDTIKYSMLDGGEVSYFIFRYNMHPPHWLSDTGWRAAVIGPYFAETKSHEIMPKLENLFVPVGEKSVKDHADAAHKKYLSSRGTRK